MSWDSELPMLTLAASATVQAPVLGGFVYGDVRLLGHKTGIRYNVTLFGQDKNGERQSFVCRCCLPCRSAAGALRIFGTCVGALFAVRIYRNSVDNMDNNTDNRGTLVNCNLS